MLTASEIKFCIGKLLNSGINKRKKQNIEAFLNQPDSKILSIYYKPYKGSKSLIKKRRKNPINCIYPPVELVQEMIDNGDIGICSLGYVYIEYKEYRGYAHRLVVMAAHIDIPKGYSIHHKDFDKLNNNLDNLEVLSWEEHKKKHHKRKSI